MPVIAKRAIRQMGLLLKEIVAAKNQYDVIARGSESPSRKQAIRDAGLSEDQGKDALRVRGPHLCAMTSDEDVDKSSHARRARVFFRLDIPS